MLKNGRDRDESHKILQQLHTRFRKRLPPLFRSQRGSEICPQTPPSDTQQRFQIPILLLVKIQLLQISKHVCGIGSDIPRPRLLDVREGVCEVCFSGFVVDPRESIEDVGER